MQRLPRLVELILALILFGVIALWSVRMLRGESIAVPPAANSGMTAGGGRVEEVLASARLFGSRRPGVLSDNVRALGVVADAGGQGSVIVSVDGQAARVYRVGDTLDGRRVTAIHADEIELESGGARQVFRLPESRPAAQGLTIIGSGPASSIPTPMVVSPGAPPVLSPAPSPYAAPLSPPPAMQPQPQLGYPPPQTSSPSVVTPNTSLEK
ncbi:MAG: type II secretion system protein N [Burkholderiaceae bacterium]